MLQQKKPSFLFQFLITRTPFSLPKNRTPFSFSRSASFIIFGFSVVGAKWSETGEFQ